MASVFEQPLLVIDAKLREFRYSAPDGVPLARSEVLAGGSGRSPVRRYFARHRPEPGPVLIRLTDPSGAALMHVERAADDPPGRVRFLDADREPLGRVERLPDARHPRIVDRWLVRYRIYDGRDRPLGAVLPRSSRGQLAGSADTFTVAGEDDDPVPHHEFAHCQGGLLSSWKRAPWPLNALVVAFPIALCLEVGG
ncbi:hypothetical protein [Actinomadura atramentaria]|uniref:hypothetical protein n=1 Tax=Actinomadura atramentaria TaxID=1990 RepID=UPI0003636EEA|nr:hypothetical protein [Actinomadura atramentaria]